VAVNAWLWNVWLYVSPFVFVAFGLRAGRYWWQEGWRLNRPMCFVYAFDAIAFTTMGLVLVVLLAAGQFP
jgi:hypothetical protein